MEYFTLLNKKAPLDAKREIEEKYHIQIYTTPNIPEEAYEEYDRLISEGTDAESANEIIMTLYGVEIPELPSLTPEQAIENLGLDTDAKIKILQQYHNGIPIEQAIEEVIRENPYVAPIYEEEKRPRECCRIRILGEVPISLEPVKMKKWFLD